MDDAHSAEPYQLMAEAAAKLLERGPMPIADLLPELDALGHLDYLRDDGVAEDDLADAVTEDLMYADDVWTTPDDVLAASSRLTEGLVLTHRLTAEELETEEVLVTPDLVVLDWNARDDDLTLASGGRLRHDFGAQRPGEDLATFGGPPGWLEGFEPGDLLAVTRSGTTCTVTRVERGGEGAGERGVERGGEGAGEREVELLRGTIDGRIMPRRGMEALPLVLDALTRDPGAFRRPVPPVGELLEAAGLERQGFSFGRSGEDWMSASEEWHQRRRDAVAAGFGLDGCCWDAFDVACDALDRFEADPTDIDARETARAIAHSAVAPALADYLLHEQERGGDRLRAFGEAVLAGARQKAPACYLLAVEAADRGDAVAAEAMLEEALRDDPDYGPPARVLATYKIDRNDFDRALALLRHPGLVAADELVEMLEGVRDTHRARYGDVGRNDSCPCGSGRKFKACCQNDPRIPLPARTGLLSRKLVMFTANPDLRSRLSGLASSACDPDDPDLVETMRAMADDPILLDFLVFEGGGAEAYLAERGPLLPDDERELIEALIDEPRRLWEVTGVDPGAALRLRDTATGDEVAVSEHLASLERDEGEYLLARVATLPDEHQLMGVPVEIPLRLRQSALALVDSRPDADTLAQWYGEALAPPTIVNREGEAMLLCDVELETGAKLAEVQAALDPHYEREGDDAWKEVWTAPSGDRVLRASIDYGDGRIAVNTNSAERLARVVATLRDALGDVTVVLDERVDPREALRRPRRDERDGPPDDLTPPELEEMMDRLIRQKEREWVDESIPALGGLTPRQALDDPTRREDLLALLREMPSGPLPGKGAGFDADRLRALLGIDEE